MIKDKIIFHYFAFTFKYSLTGFNKFLKIELVVKSTSVVWYFVSSVCFKYILIRNLYNFFYGALKITMIFVFLI